MLWQTAHFGFGVARAALGVSEAGNFPAAIKTVAEWFPKKKEPLLRAFFNSGSNIGAIIAPLTVPLIAVTMGWKWAFIITGAVGFIWVIFWLVMYEIPAKHKGLSGREHNYILSDNEDTSAAESAGQKAPPVSWFKILSYRQTWAFAVGKFLTDPVWWFYLFWLPAFLKAQYHIEGTASAIPIAAVYTMTTFGSVFGGYLPLYFIKKDGRFTGQEKHQCLFMPFVLYLSCLPNTLVHSACGMQFSSLAWQPLPTRHGAPIFSPPPQICSLKERWLLLQVSAAWPVLSAVYSLPGLQVFSSTISKPREELKPAIILCL